MTTVRPHLIDVMWSTTVMLYRMATEPVLSIESGRAVHLLWGKICWPLDVSC